MAYLNKNDLKFDEPKAAGTFASSVKFDEPTGTGGDDFALHPAFDEQAAQDEMTGIASHLAFGADPRTTSAHAAAVRESLSKDANAQATFDGAHTFAREISTLLPAKPTTFRPNLAPLGITEPTSRQRVERVGKAYVEAGIISKQELDDTLSAEKADQLPWWMDQPRPRFFYHKSLEQEINDTPKTIGATGLAMVQGFYGSVAAISGNTPVGEGARELVKKIDRAIQRTAPERGSFYQDVVGGFTSMAVFVTPGVAVEKGLSLAGLEMAGWVSRATHSSMMSATEATFEAGDAYNQKFKETGSHDEARRSAAIVFFSNLPLLAVTNYLGVAAAKGTKITQLSGLQRAAQTGKSALFEGSQESAQAVIQDVGLGKPIDAGDALYQGLIGAIVGGGMTAVEESLQAINQARTVPPEVEQLYSSEVERNLAQGMEPEQAHIEATRAIAATPEGEQYLETVANAFEASLRAEAAIGQAEEDLNVPRGTIDDDAFELLINQELGDYEVTNILDTRRDDLNEEDVNAAVEEILVERYGEEAVRATGPDAIQEISIQRQILRDALSTDINKLTQVTENFGVEDEELIQHIQSLNDEVDEAGSLYIPSPEEITAAVGRIKEAVQNPAQAAQDLLDIGKSVFNDGVTDLKNFTARMRSYLGDAWNTFKDMVQRVWTALKAFNAQLGERGSVPITPEGKPILDLQDRIEKAYYRAKNKRDVNEVIVALDRARKGQAVTEEQKEIIVDSLGFIASEFQKEVLATKEDFIDITEYLEEGELDSIIEAEIKKYISQLKVKAPVKSAPVKKAPDQSEEVARLRALMGDRVKTIWQLQDALAESQAEAKKTGKKVERLETRVSGLKSTVSELRGQIRKASAPKQTVKQRIREITGQTTPEQLRRYIREDVALEAAFTKAAQAARKAMSEGNKVGIAKERARMREILDKAQRKLSAQKASIARVNKQIREINIEEVEIEDYTGENYREYVTLVTDEFGVESTELKTFRAAAAAAKKAYKSGKRQGRDEALAQMREIVDRAKAKKRDREEVAKVKKQIKKIKKSGSKSIAVDYQKQINQLIEGLDLSKPSAKTQRRLEGLRQYLEREGENANVPPEYVAKLKRLEKTPISELSKEQRDELKRSIDTLKQLGKLKLQLKNKYNEIERQKELARAIEGTVNTDPDKSLNSKGEQTWKTLSATATKAAYYQTLHAPRVFDTMDGLQNYKGWNSQQERKLQRAETEAKQDIALTIDEALNDIKEKAGAEFDEERQARIVLHVRLQEGAHDQANVILDNYSEKFGWGDSVPELREGDQEVINIVQRVMTRDSAKLAAIHEERTNSIFPFLENYVMPIYYEQSMSPEADPVGDINRFRTAQTFQGFTRQRVPGVKKLPRVDLFGMLEQAVNAQKWYIHMQPVIDDIRPIVNSQEYLDSAGEFNYEYWKDHLDIVSQRGWSIAAASEKTGIAKWLTPALRKARINLNQAILGYKLTTIALQPFAVFDAMAYMTAKHGPIAAGKVLSTTLQSWIRPGYAKSMIEISPALQQRQGGEIALEETLARAQGRTGAWNAYLRAGMQAISKSDVITAAGVERAAYEILKAEGVENALEEAEFIMNLTQASADVVNRPHVLSRGEGARLWFTFQSFVLNRWGLVWHDIIRAGVVRGNAVAKLRSVLALAILAAAGLGEDEAREKIYELFSKKKLKERPAWVDILLFIPELIPVIGPFIESAGRGLSAQPPLTRTIDNFFSGINSALFGRKTETKVRGLLRSMEAMLAILLGIPGTAQGFDFIESIVTENKKGKRS